MVKGSGRQPPADLEYPATSLRIGVRDAKAGLSQLLREVKAGREVIITEYGIPVARLIPVRELSLEDRIAEMEARGEIEPMKPAARPLRPLHVPEGLAQKYLQEGRE
jgi:prevent-host-death family protein